MKKTKKRCTKPYFMNKDKLLRTIHKSACSNASTRAMVDDLSYPESGDHMTYEEFSKDKGGLLSDLMRLSQLISMIDSRKPPTTLKRTPLNLSTTITNAAEVHRSRKRAAEARSGFDKKVVIATSGTSGQHA